MGYSNLQQIDPELAEALNYELERQKTHLELIASENFVSENVLLAQGSILTNKYAEGYPGKRYYGGCEFVDIAEELAGNRACELFGADHANVQPHSGSQANTAVYLAFLKPGDTVMGMNLNQGGHLTHGSQVSISGMYYNFVFYGVNRDTGYIDYNELEKIAWEHKPKLIVAGASAYPRTIDFAKFREIADEVGAILMVDMAHIAGLVAAGLHQSPVPYADIVTSTTHKTLRGPRGGFILCGEKYARQIDKAVFPGLQGGPLMHIIAAKAVAFKEAMSDDFKKYQIQIKNNARKLSDNLQEKGFKIVSGGTDTHLLLIDLRNKGITGKKAENMLAEANITVNKNSIPYDPQKPTVTSGIRVGTAAVTSRGLNEEDMKLLAEAMDLVLSNKSDQNGVLQAGRIVRELCEKHPLYPNL